MRLLISIIFILSIFPSISSASFEDEFAIILDISRPDNKDIALGRYNLFVYEKIVDESLNWKEVVKNGSKMMEMLGERIKSGTLKESEVWLTELKELVGDLIMKPYFHYLDNAYNPLLDILYVKGKEVRDDSHLIREVHSYIREYKELVDMQTNQVVSYIRSLSGIEFFLYKNALPQDGILYRYIFLRDYEVPRAQKLLQQTDMTSPLAIYLKKMAEAFDTSEAEVLYRMDGFWKKYLREELSKLIIQLEDDPQLAQREDLTILKTEYYTWVRDGRDTNKMFMELTEGNNYLQLQNFIVISIDDLLRQVMTDSQLSLDEGTVKSSEIPKVMDSVKKYDQNFQEFLEEVANRPKIEPIRFSKEIPGNLSLIYVIKSPWSFDNSEIPRVENAIAIFRSIKSKEQFFYMISDDPENFDFIFRFLYATDNRKIHSALNEYVKIVAAKKGISFKTDVPAREMILKGDEGLKDIFSNDYVNLVKEQNQNVLNDLFSGLEDAFKGHQLFQGCDPYMTNLN